MPSLSFRASRGISFLPNFIKILRRLRMTETSFVVHSKYREGQSLIEVMLIVVLITAVIAGSVGFLVQAYSITQLVSDQTTATYLSMEGIEVAKNILDGGYQKTGSWNSALANTGENITQNVANCYQLDYESAGFENGVTCGNLLGEKFLKFDPATNHYGYFSQQDASVNAVETPQQFQRRIEITPIGANEIKAVSVVNWQSRRCQSGGCELRLEDYFYNWRQ